MNLKVSSTDSTDENLVLNERNSGSSSASISISFSDDENEKPKIILCEKPSQALLTKIKKIKSLLKASSTMIPPNQDQSDEDDEEKIVDFSAQSIIVKSQEILKSEEVDDHSGVQKARKIKYSPLKNPTSISDDIASFASQRG